MYNIQSAATLMEIYSQLDYDHNADLTIRRVYILIGGRLDHLEKQGIGEEPVLI